MRYWVIAPMESTTPPELFQKAWDYDKHEGTIAIGWPIHTQAGEPIFLQADAAAEPKGTESVVDGMIQALADVSGAGFDEFQQDVKNLNEQYELGWGPRTPKMIWEFHRDIQVGDKIVARRGLNRVLGIGTVRETATYDFTKGTARIGIYGYPISDTEYPHVRPRFISVNWEHTGEFAAKLPWRRTVQEITSEQYHNVLAELDLGAAAPSDSTAADFTTGESNLPSATEKDNLPSETEKSEPPIPTEKNEPPITLGTGPQRGPTISSTETEAPALKRSTAPRAILPQAAPRETEVEPTAKAPEAQPARPNYYIGIDLGTTNSVMGWGTLNPQTNQLEPKIVEINMMIERGGMGKKELLPSCVYFKEGSAPIVGEYAKTMIGRQTRRVVKSIKSEMGTQKQFQFDDTTYAPATISSQILTHLTSSAKALFGFTPDDVVITVPASFDSDMRAATIEAARLAGFRTQEDDGSPRNILLDEPRAALYDFINRQNKGEIPETLINFQTPQFVLVFDLGGGTLDVSLHRVTMGDGAQEQQSLNIEDLAISRYTQIGGDDFDQRLADYFWDAYHKRLPDNLDDTQIDTIKNHLREYAEQAKIDLSSEIETSKLMGCFDPETVETAITQTPFERLIFRHDLTLSEYEEVVEPLLAPHLTLESVKQLDTLPACDNVVYPVLDVLRKAEHKLENLPRVDAVLLNGGMTKLHTVQKRLETLFGFPPITAGDPDKAVARGAVVYHFDLHRGIKPARILNDTIGIEIAGGRVKPLVEAGTILPLSQPKPIEGLQVSDGAPSLRLPFYLGSRRDTQPPNRRILERNVRFQRPLLKNEPIFIQVQVDERGIMNVEGWPKANPNERFTVSVDSTQPEEVAYTGRGPSRSAFDVVAGRQTSTPAQDVNARMQGQGASSFGSSYTGSVSPRSGSETASPPAGRTRQHIIGRPAPGAGRQRDIDRPGARGTEPSQGTVLDVRYELTEMKKNFSYYMRTYQVHRKKAIMEQITRQRTKIAAAVNAEEFITPLLENIEYVNNYGKARTMVLLGDLAGRCKNTDLLYDIVDAAKALSPPEDIRNRHPQVIKTVVRYAVEAIGKTRLPIAESHLISLLNEETPIAVRPSAVYSIGKCCHSVNAIEHLKSLIEYGLAADRIAANWAFGKMGSREHEQPLPIQHLEPVVAILMEQLQSEPHNDVKRNGIYALGEICDRRECAKDIIDEERSRAVIQLIEPFLNFRTDGSLAELANMQQMRLIKRFAGVSLNMIRGVQLSAEQAASLLTIRTEN